MAVRAELSLPAFDTATDTSAILVLMVAGPAVFNRRDWLSAAGRSLRDGGC